MVNTGMDMTNLRDLKNDLVKKVVILDQHYQQKMDEAIEIHTSLLRTKETLTTIKATIDYFTEKTDGG